MIQVVDCIPSSSGGVHPGGLLMHAHPVAAIANGNTAIPMAAHAQAVTPAIALRRIVQGRDAGTIDRSNATAPNATR